MAKKGGLGLGLGLDADRKVAGMFWSIGYPENKGGETTTDKAYVRADDDVIDALSVLEGDVQLGVAFSAGSKNTNTVVTVNSVDVIVKTVKAADDTAAKELFTNPVHPYTKALLSAIPIPDPDAQVEQIPLKGEISSPINMARDCHFAARCPYATEACHASTPELVDRGNDHFVACHLF